MTAIPAKQMGPYDLEAVNTTHPNLSKDLQLQVYQRLDWRFLLPDPDLGRAAYLGPENSPLLAALQWVDGTILHDRTVLNSGAHSSAYDLVVVKNPAVKTLELAQKLVKPGGSLYVESQGWARLVRPRQLLNHFNNLLNRADPSARLWFPPACKAAIERAGFSSLQVYWHWPNFEVCTRMIKVNNTDTHTLAFSFQENGLQLVLKKALLRGLLPLGWVQYWLPDFSIFGVKEAA